MSASETEIARLLARETQHAAAPNVQRFVRSGR
jgi:hypothetical protein